MSSNEEYLYECEQQHHDEVNKVNKYNQLQTLEATEVPESPNTIEGEYVNEN